MKQGELVWCRKALSDFILVFQATVIYESDGIVKVMEQNRFNVSNGVSRLPEWELPIDCVHHLKEDALDAAKKMKPKGKPNGGNNHNKGGRP